MSDNSVSDNSLNSASITRGFKSGYDIRQTGGQGQNGINPPPILISQTCTRRVSQTSTRTVARYSSACGVWNFQCFVQGNGTACNYINNFCPQYVQETYDSSYDESYDCSYLSYPPITAAGGNGGAGATGGNGGTDSAGGGGGSGYTDGSVTVVSTQQGGSTGFSKIIIRAV